MSLAILTPAVPTLQDPHDEERGEASRDGEGEERGGEGRMKKGW